MSPKVSESPNQEQLAEMIGISVDTLNNYKKLTELIPELEELLDTGVVTKRRVLSFTYTIIKKKHVQIIKHRIKSSLRLLYRRDLLIYDTKVV